MKIGALSRETGATARLQTCVLDHLRVHLAGLDSRIRGLNDARTALGGILDASTRALADSSG
ncbi:hypothetical protein [Spirillospora sp. NPDC047279]|uniref:hypothetical protein n=1 Tax=Spirillospora sp. NPDC047279 TaxID=3155478 RepID=UPI0033DA4EDE